MLAGIGVWYVVGLSMVSISLGGLMREASSGSVSHVIIESKMTRITNTINC